MHIYIYIDLCIHIYIYMMSYLICIFIICTCMISYHIHIYTYVHIHRYVVQPESQCIHSMTYLWLVLTSQGDILGSEHFCNCRGHDRTGEPTTKSWMMGDGSQVPLLGGCFKYFLFLTLPTWGDDPIWFIFFKWVETMVHLKNGTLL